jgi:hypothetical protein
MSMTSIIAENHDFRAAVKAGTKRPKVPKPGPNYIQPASKRHGLVGTAFDYLIGYILEHRNRGMVKKSGAPIAIRSYCILRDLARSDDQRRKVQDVEALIINHMRNADDFIASGDLTREMIASTLQVANLDQIYRAGILPRQLIKKAYEADIDDINRMYRAVPLERFTATKEAFTGPDFGQSSRLIGGADADFIIDGALIDTKTSMKLAIPLSMWCQVVGYYLLNRVERLKGHAFYDVDRIGFYFARHGQFLEIDIEQAIDDPNELLRAMFFLVPAVNDGWEVPASQID